MKSKLMLLGFLANAVIAAILVWLVQVGHKSAGLIFVIWTVLSWQQQTWFLASKIDRIGDQLGFGVSVPITEMPRVMDQIQKRIKGSAADLLHPDTTPDPIKAKRPKRDILAELTDLEGEMP